MAYNGWKNYETWCVSLWIDNEEASYRHYRLQAREIQRAHEPEDQARELAGLLKAETEEAASNLGGVPGTVFADLIQSSLDNVDWEEIAQSILDE